MSTASRESFAKKLNDARVDQHISIRAAARIAEVPTATVHGWLGGKHFPVPALRPNYLRLVAHLGLSDELPADLWSNDWDEIEPVLDRVRPPYLGLRPFGVADCELFYGRSGESRRIAQAIARLRDQAGCGIVVLIGASGSGKSSLLAAGLIARECTEGLLSGTSARLTDPAGLADSDFADTDLVVVDQFEDFFQLPGAQRNAAGDALTDLAKASLVVIGLRSDAFGAAAGLPVLQEPLTRPILLSAPDRDGLSEMILGPAGLCSVAVDPELVQVVLSDLTLGTPELCTGTDVLPLLSTVLLLTWAAGNGQRMTVADYQRTGGISTAVESLAEQAYQSLDEPQQTAAERLFLRLVRVESDVVVREALPLARLGPAAQKVADRFVAARMLTISGESIRISHDALLAHWARLRGWVDERRDDLIALGGLRRAAAVWEDSGRVPDALLPIAQFASVAAWVGDPDRRALLTGPERDYLAASESHFTAVLAAERETNRRLRRQRQFAFGLVIGTTLLAMIASGFYASSKAFQQQAETARNEAQSRQVAVQATSLRSKSPNLLVQMSLVATSIATTTESRSTLLDATAVDSPLRWSGDSAAVVAVDEAAGIVVRGDGSGDLTLWRDEELYSQQGSRVVVDPAGGSIFALDVTTVGSRTLVAVAGQGIRELWDITADPVKLAALSDDDVTTYAARFSIGGDAVLFGAGDGTIQRWNIIDPTRPRLVANLDLGTDQPAVSSLAVDASGTLYAAGIQGVIRRWHWQGSSYRALGDIAVLSAAEPRAAVRVQSLAVTPDGGRLAAGLAGRAVLRWQIEQGEPTELTPLTAFTSYVNQVAYSADGSQLITASSDQDVVVFDDATGTEIRRMTTPSIALGAAWFDGHPVATGADGSLQVWRSESPVWRISGSTAYNMSVGGKVPRWLAAGTPDDGIVLWRVGAKSTRMPTPKVEGLPDGDVQQGAVAVAPNGKFLVGATAGGRVLSWPLTAAGAGKVRVTPVGDQYLAFATVSPDSTLVAVMEYPTQGTTKIATHLLRADETGELTAVGSIPTDDPQLVWFNADGSLLAVALADRKVELWQVTDPANPTLVGTISGLETMPATINFAPTSPILAIGEESGAVSLWDISEPAAPTLTRRFDDAQSSMYSLAFSDDETLLVGASGDDLVWGWRLDEDQNSAWFSLNGDIGRPWDTRFLDSTRLAISGVDGAVKVWNVDPVEARESLCAWRGDPMTTAEWERYLPGVRPIDPC